MDALDRDIGHLEAEPGLYEPFAGVTSRSDPADRVRKVEGGAQLAPVTMANGFCLAEVVP